MEFPPHLEYASDLVRKLPRSGNDMPVYARTPHGTYRFVITDVEIVEIDAEDVAVLVLQEVSQ